MRPSTCIIDLLKPTDRAATPLVTMDFPLPQFVPDCRIPVKPGFWTRLTDAGLPDGLKMRRAISNCYSTGEHWDEDSGDIQEHSYEMGYADRGTDLDFARAYGAVNLKLRSLSPL